MKDTSGFITTIALNADFLKTVTWSLHKPQSMVLPVPLGRLVQGLNVVK